MRIDKKTIHRCDSRSQEKSITQYPISNLNLAGIAFQLQMLFLEAMGAVAAADLNQKE